MKPSEQLLIAMINTLEEKFPEDKKKLEEFARIMWYESYDLTEKEHEAINNFIEYITNKMMSA